MNILKKAPLMALVFGLGLITIVGMSSFKGTSSAARLDSITFYHVGNNYTADINAISGKSCQEDTQYCRIVYTQTEPTSVLPSEDFSENAIPPATSDYTLSQQVADASYQ